MTFPGLLEYSDAALFLLRLMLAVVFGWSGWSHATAPRARGESIGMPPAVAFILGVVEVAGAAMLVIGLWPQLAALALAAVMLGALYKKVFVWKKGFWGDANDGWYYEILYLAALLVIATTGGGSIRIT